MSLMWRWRVLKQMIFYGTYLKAEGEGMQSVIVTGDLDLLQLPSPLIEVLVTKRNFSIERFTPQK